ncbi:hypothetical protein D9611_008308 [Ephemerocybe angulata]|uniref:Uncharacterized protein n=1 Tax=Ephemerocybe angulata TaxID=980116 RepID=A0A8H5BJ43_9AGAR|nr:hypothetical protein D9611_008308 [Tulosesus angulatus]
MDVIPAPKATGASQRRSVDPPLYEPATRHAKEISSQESLGRGVDNWETVQHDQFYFTVPVFMAVILLR